MANRARSIFLSLGCAGVFTASAAAPDPVEAAFRALYKQLLEINTTRSVGSRTQAADAMRAHGLNERIRVKSLMNSRRFLYEVVKLCANGGE